MSTKCVICCIDALFVAIGKCNHPVCFECSARLRLLCDDTACSICREPLAIVYIVAVRRQDEDFRSLSLCDDWIRHESEDGILFDGQDSLRAYHDIQSFVCPFDDTAFPNFEQLRQHVQRNHQRFYCDLCFENLRLFPMERRCYSRQDLVRHRKAGDPDNTTYRGHPPCKFCDERYFDADALYKHLRTGHFFCHFCDADGVNEFYCDYPELRTHFMNEHYLCELGDCVRERFVNAFRSEVDMKAHKTRNHSQALGRSQLRQERVVNLDLNYRTGAETERFSDDGGRQGGGPGPPAGFRGRGAHARGMRGGNYRGRNSMPSPRDGPRADQTEEDYRQRQNAQRAAVLRGLRERQPHQPQAPRTTRDTTAIRGGHTRGAGAAREQMSDAVNRTESVSDPESEMRKAKAAEVEKEFVLQNEEKSFPSLGGLNSAQSVAPGKRSMASAVSRGQALLNEQGQIDENEYPALATSSTVAAPLSIMRSASKPKKQQQRQYGAPKINDAEQFPSISGMQPPRVIPPPSTAYLGRVVEPPRPAEKEKTQKQQQPTALQHSAADFPVLGGSSSNQQQTGGGSIVESGGGKMTTWSVQTEKRVTTESNIARSSQIQQAYEPIEFKEDAFPVLGGGAASSSAKAKKTKGAKSKQPKTNNDGSTTTTADAAYGFWKAVKLKNNIILAASAPPPGFEAPPGFDADLPPGFTADDDVAAEYKQPLNYDERNVTLRDSIGKVVMNRMGDFCSNSQRFLAGDTSAAEFYSAMKCELGQFQLDRLFAEFVALMPDVCKQAAVFDVHCSKHRNNKTVDMNLERCCVCGQFLITRDFAQHVEQHRI